MPQHKSASLDILDTSVLILFFILFFFNDTATTEIYTLSLHDALPIAQPSERSRLTVNGKSDGLWTAPGIALPIAGAVDGFQYKSARANRPKLRALCPISRDWQPASPEFEALLLCWERPFVDPLPGAGGRRPRPKAAEVLLPRIDRRHPRSPTPSRAPSRLHPSRPTTTRPAPVPQPTARTGGRAVPCPAVRRDR